ncbi:MAG: Gfo/Idh/MocA family oxidoreductase [Verrucomicrobia bacterium]|nr:Gfo/Idh/MocA family oxidoreductase [Verrucomicrobiota bacterium]MDE3100308.1 Gfo/Idh/MocA family oxidoreductase [Verrucomicrobiota bacterium]
MAKTFRVGLIGWRFMGRAHSNAWRQAPRFFNLKANVELHTICGRKPAAVQAARLQLGWQNATGDWREIVSSPLIDIVDIVTPTHCHAEMAIEALKNGKHVLCEKPMGLNLKQCEQMFAAAQKARTVHMVCHNYRRIPAIALAKKIISEGALGRIYHFRARYAQDRLADPEFPLDWRLQKETSGSGVHSDINSHIIDLARYLVGEFKEVCGLVNTFITERPIAGEFSKGARKTGKVTAPDSAAFIGWMESGAMANLEATRYALGRKNHIEIEINGAKGSIYFDFEDMNRLKFYNGADPADRRGFRDILVTERDGIHPYVANWWPPGHGIGYEHTFIHAVADFVNACADGKPVHPTFEDGLKNQRVLTAVEESSKKGKWMKV